MAFASSGSTPVRTAGAVSGSGEISTHVTAIKAGTGITLESDADRVVTIKSSGGGGGGNTLDSAYDQGGSGAGRTITADNGSVKITSSANFPLELESTSAAMGLLKCEGNSNAITFGVSSENENSVLVCAGPIQSSQENVVTGGNAKVPDPSALDLQFATSDPSFTAHGTNSALVGGSGNAIAVTGGSPSIPEADDGATSIRASSAIIAGGSANTIKSQQALAAANRSSILGGNGNTIEVDLTAGYGLVFGSEDSGIISSNRGTILNSSTSAIVGGQRGEVKNHQDSVVIGGLSNTITTPLSDPVSAAQGHANTIIGGQGNQMEIRLQGARNSGDTTTLLGENNVIAGGRHNVVSLEARNCLVVGTGGKASSDFGNNRNDDAVLYVGSSGHTHSGGGGTTENGIALIGLSSRTGGTADAGKVLCDDSLAATGADYAEMFEWDDGNANDEDRVGLFVKISTDGSGLPNGKVEVGGDGMVVGPVSSIPGATVNSSPLNWNSKYIKDDFGRKILDSDGKRQLNPNFDEAQNYSNRGSRKEWTPIALKGRVRVRASTNIGIYPSNKSGLTVNVNADGTVSDAGAKGKYKVLQVVKQKEIWSGPQGLFRSRTLVQDHGYGVVEILVE